MNPKTAHFFRRFSLLFLFFMTSCGTPPTLISKSAAIPAGVDLSGLWAVRIGAPTRRMEKGTGIRKELGHARKMRPSRRSRTSDGVSAHVFLQYGTKLKITQTDFGIFISYDRSVVDEFTFGENRIIKLGPIEALRASGWEDNSFVVETLDDSGTTLFESWFLEQGGSVLVRNIRISKGEEEKFFEEQRFDRQLKR